MPGLDATHYLQEHKHFLLVLAIDITIGLIRLVYLRGEALFDWTAIISIKIHRDEIIEPEQVELIIFNYSSTKSKAIMGISAHSY